MSGHSKWSTIKRKKGAADAKRGKLFSKIIKEITVIARSGGGNPDDNPRLRTVIATAKAANMPADNIDRAIKKGTGELEGATYEDITFEGYGPSGVAVMVECLTDNRNRSVSEVRHVFSKYGGNLGENGCVAWIFDKKGMITLPREGITEDQLMEIALEAGAEDIDQEEESFTVLCPYTDLDAVKQAIEDAGMAISDASVTMLPQNRITLEGKASQTTLTLLDLLEDLEDVQNVYANYDISDEDIETWQNS